RCCTTGASSPTARASRSRPIRRSRRSTLALEVEGLHTYYGESHVLHGVSLRVDPGEVLAILGRNGMGKTTLIRSIVGFTPPREGRVRYKETELTTLPPYRMVDLGMALVPQGRRVFPSLSVRENLDVARHGTGQCSLQQVYALFPRLGEPRAVVCFFSAPAGARGQPGEQALRRRAADARDRPGADVESRPAAAGRAPRGPGAFAGARGRPGARGAQARRALDVSGGAESRPSMCARRPG